MTLRRIALFAPLAAFLLFVVLAVTMLGRPQQQVIVSQLVGKPMPQFALDGPDPLHPGLTSSDLAQGNVVLVNLFASWCLPCRVEAPQLQTLADSGVVIHAIAIRDTPAAIHAFLQKHGDPFRRIGLDPAGRVQIALGSSGVPETFVVDGRGIIRYQHIGPIEADDVATILAQIEAAK